MNIPLACLIFLASISTTPAAVFYNYQMIGSPSITSPSDLSPAGFGSYFGFSINLGGDLTTLNDGENDLEGEINVYIKKMTICKATNNMEAKKDNPNGIVSGGRVYVCLFTAPDNFTKETFVGASVARVNMQSSGQTKGAGEWVVADFNNVRVELKKTYYVMFSSVNPNGPNGFQFVPVKGRLRMGKASDGVIADSASVYKDKMGKVEKEWQAVYSAVLSVTP